MGLGYDETLYFTYTEMMSGIPQSAHTLERLGFFPVVHVFRRIDLSMDETWENKDSPAGWERKHFEKKALARASIGDVVVIIDEACKVYATTKARTRLAVEKAKKLKKTVRFRDSAVMPVDGDEEIDGSSLGLRDPFCP